MPEKEALAAYLERARQPSKPPPIARIDSGYGEILRERAERASVTQISQAGPPEQVAEVNRIARNRNLPTSVVDGDLNAMRDMERLDKFLSIGRRNGRFRQWQQDNPRDAAASTDDAAALGRVADAFDVKELSRGWSIKAPPEVEPTLLNSITGIWANLVGSLDQLEASGALALGDMLPREPWETAHQQELSNQSMMGDFRRATSRIGAAQPAFKTSTATGVYSGVASFVHMLPGLVASVATRSPAPAMILAGAQSGVPAYGKYRSRGGSPSEAALGASIEGGSEALFELLPMSTVARKFGGGSPGSFLGEYLGRELVTEELTTLVQDAADRAAAIFWLTSKKTRASISNHLVSRSSDSSTELKRRRARSCSSKLRFSMAHATCMFPGDGNQQQPPTARKLESQSEALNGRGGVIVHTSFLAAMRASSAVSTPCLAVFACCCAMCSKLMPWEISSRNGCRALGSTFPTSSTRDQISSKVLSIV